MSISRGFAISRPAGAPAGQGGYLRGPGPGAAEPHVRSAAGGATGGGGDARGRGGRCAGPEGRRAEPSRVRPRSAAQQQATPSKACPRKARAQISGAASSPQGAMQRICAAAARTTSQLSWGEDAQSVVARAGERGWRTRRESRGVHLAGSSAALRLCLCPRRVLLPADVGPCLSPSSPAASFSFSSPFFNFRACSERTSQKVWCLYPDY